MSKNTIIGFVGFIGSGKDTAADYLVNTHEFKRDSFANTLKDAVAAVFGWDRILLEGRTKTAREWREEIDIWWADRLGIPNLTPRLMLQLWGTEVCRVGFHDDIWIASLENKIRKTTDNVVISDVRFPNEIKAIHNAGGIVIQIQRGIKPHWYDIAIQANRGVQNAITFLKNEGIHASETSWVGDDIDHIVSNNSTIDALFDQINNLLTTTELPFATKVALDLI